jgi:hypothetical protein
MVLNPQMNAYEPMQKNWIKARIYHHLRAKFG